MPHQASSNKSHLFILLLGITTTICCGLLLLSSKANALTVSPPRIETKTDPGKTVNETVKLINDKNESKTLYLLVQNFEAKNESGEPEYVEGTEGLAGWISIPKSITLGPGETKDINVKISVPNNAEPGGYFTALFFRDSPPTFEQGRNIAVSSQLGALFLLTVNGNISDQAGILEFATKDKQRIFKTLPIEFYYRFQNTGNTWVKPLGDILISNTVGLNTKLLSANRTKGNVLPKSIRKFDSFWINSGGNKQEDPNVKPEYPDLHGFWENVKYQYHHFALGFYTAKLNLAYSEPAQAANSSFMFFVFPWQLIVVSLISLIILFLILRFVIKRYNRRIIQKAQAENKK